MGPGRGGAPHVIHSSAITPNVPLDTGIRAIGKSGGIDPFGGMGVVLLRLRPCSHRHTNMVSSKCLSPDKALAAGIRTVRASSRLATPRGLRVILLGLGA